MSFNVNSQDTQPATTLFEHLWRQASCVADVDEPAHDADARLVAAAAGAEAQLFVTGDQRVLGWVEHGAMRIIAPREAWGVLFTTG